jgi:hypothetical protein
LHRREKNISHLIFHYQIVWDVQNLQMFNPEIKKSRKMAFNSILFLPEVGGEEKNFLIYHSASFASFALIFCFETKKHEIN